MNEKLKQSMIQNEQEEDMTIAKGGKQRDENFNTNQSSIEEHRNNHQAQLSTITELNESYLSTLGQNNQSALLANSSKSLDISLLDPDQNSSHLNKEKDSCCKRFCTAIKNFFKTPKNEKQPDEK